MSTLTGAGGRSGFTMIEISIVLVIIGLIAGGIMVGRDLIRAAGIRATISQYDKFKTAVMVFKNKYNLIPGDMTNANAAAFGFQSSNGNGDGRLQDCIGRQFESCGENVFFWQHLGAAGLIEGGFNLASTSVTAYDPTQYSALFPKAHMGDNSYWMAFGQSTFSDTPNALFVVQIVSLDQTSVAATTAGAVNASVPAMDLYTLDTKIDDGMPDSGIIRAVGVWNGLVGTPWITTTPPNWNCPNGTSVCLDAGSGQYVYDMTHGNQIGFIPEFRLDLPQ